MTDLSHPYLDREQGALSAHYKYSELLHKRMKLIKEGNATRSEYEQNEVEITMTKTQIEIDSLSKKIGFRERYFKTWIRQFAADCQEMERHYDKVLADAKANSNKKKKNATIQQVLDSVNWSFVETSIEAKLKLYQQLKEMLA